MSEGYFRSKKGFTVVQNYITRDKTVTLKAKGLYLVIQSNITMPGVKWKKSDFSDMAMEGKKAFDSAWDELKNKGYLHVHIYSNGKTFTVEYELLDEPDDSAHTYYYNGKGELTRTNKSRTPHFGSNGNGSNGNGNNGEGSNGSGSIGNGNNGNGSNEKGDNNNKSLFIKTENKTTESNPSIYHDQEGIDKKQMDSIDEVEIYRDIIRENIDYDAVMASRPITETEVFKEIYEVMCDVVCIPRKTIRINKEDYPYALVKSKFLKLNYAHIEYVMECLDKVKGNIDNIRSYLVTALYNAPDTINSYYKMEVQRDFNIT